MSTPTLKLLARAACVACLAPACSHPPAGVRAEAPAAESPGPRTTRFDAKVDVAPLLQAGCVAAEKGLDCTRGALARLGCVGPSVVVDALGALTPKAAIATCDGDERGGLDEGLAVVGCGLAATTRRYLVASGGKAELVTSEAELAARFAPVETPEEALAFALAATTARALTEVVVPEGAARPGGRIDPTYVETTTQGFKVRVFDLRACGCGRHDWEAIDLFVTRAGAVKELGRAPIFEEPTLRRACVD